MLRQALALAVVAWLPGAVLYRLPVGDRTRRAAADPEERLYWAVILSIAISLATALLLAFFGVYTFRLLVLVDVALALVAAIGSRFNLRLAAQRRWLSLSAILPIALIVLGVWRFFPPSEFVLGGKDPGVYMNEGIQIAQRGTFIYEDPLVTAIPPFARDLFFRSDHRPEFYGLRFMGFPLLDIESGRVVGQFPHLFPASIAIGYGIDGLTGARKVVGVWAILGLLSVYFLGARLFGRLVGFAGAALLALNIAQVWFSRYPNAEVVMQALVFAALLATVRAFDDDDGFFAPVAGALLGLLLFLRVDAALAIAGVAGGLALLAITDGRWRVSFFVPLVALAPLACAYLAGPMRPYADRYITFARITSWWQYLLAASVVVVLAGLAVLSRNESVRARVRALTPRLMTAALILGAVYALYFRQPAGRLAAHDAYALRTFTEYYLTLPGLVAALVGYALAARRAFWRAPAFFTTVAVYAFFFFYKIYVVPEHFWMARRYVPVILPAAMLLAAVAALGTRGGPSLLRPLRWTIGVIFLGLLGREYARVSERIGNHVEYAGIIPRLEQLASSIGDRDLLIVESMDAQTDVHTLAVPLSYIYARNVLVFTSAAPDKTDFAGFLEWTAQKFDRVLFLGAGGTDLLSREWGSRVIASDRFRVPEFVGAPNEFPRHARVKQFDYTIYQFVQPAADQAAGAASIDIGTEDDLSVLRFHAKEETEGRTFRWSQDISYVTVKGLTEHHRLLTLWMSNGGRPDAAPPAVVTVHLDDEPIGTARIENGFRPYTFDIPPALAARIAARTTPARLKLTTSVWSPETVLGTPDDRELGVMVDRLALK